MSELPRQLNANSAIIALSSFIILGAIGWVGNKTSENADTIARMETSVPYMTQAISDLKAQVATLVTRSELESRLNEMGMRITTVERRVIILETEKKIREQIIPPK